LSESSGVVAATIGEGDSVGGPLPSVELKLVDIPEMGYLAASR
jgi:hypothetical protein